MTGHKGDKHFRLADHGEVFSTRPKGQELLALVELELASASTLEVDFSGVRSISYSFADEFVGELSERAARGTYRAEFAFTNVPANAERVIAGSLERRGLDSSGGIAAAWPTRA